MKIHPAEDVILDTFVVLPQEARDWAILNGVNLPPLGAVQDDDSSTATVRLLSPDPYTNYEISPITPIDTQRIRFSTAVPSNTTQLDYYLNDEFYQSSTDNPFDVWWQLEIGEWELQAIATLADGTELESEILYFGVVDLSQHNPVLCHRANRCYSINVARIPCNQLTASDNS